MLSFKINKSDSELISSIVTRAQQIEKSLDCLSLRMDLMACHANGCPMNFQKLLDADDFNFTHDVSGIMRHLNRKTGKLEDCFLPRFATRVQS